MIRKAKNADEMWQVARRKSAVQMNPMFKGRDFLVQANLCFVLMPFEPEMQPIYHDHIKKVLVSLGLESQRADDIFGPTEIIEDIWQNINRARILIADLTGKNPNVFYEVGVAHTVGKEVLLITQHIEDVPFDLSHLRHIQYEYTPRGMVLFEQKLKANILHVLGRADEVQAG